MAERVVKRGSRSGLGAAVGLAVSKRQGVGGRQATSPLAGRGGGYPGICTASNFENCTARDPRLDELVVMGQPAYLIRVAEGIGFDAYMVMWRILDAELSIRTDEGAIALRLRPFRSYLRFQRNRYIEALCGAGLEVREIQLAVRKRLSEHISIRHISRLARGK